MILRILLPLLFCSEIMARGGGRRHGGGGGGWTAEDLKLFLGLLGGAVAVFFIGCACWECRKCKRAEREWQEKNAKVVYIDEQEMDLMDILKRGVHDNRVDSDPISR